MFLEHIYATWQSKAANEQHGQNSCLMCPLYHSLQFITAVIKFVDDLLVKILLAGAHSV